MRFNGHEGMTIEAAQKWVIPFGKYKGELVSDVYCEDEEYIDWLHEKLNDDDYLKFAIDLVCYTPDN